MKVEVGLRATYERTFTAEDVRGFAELSGDKGIHHMRPDSQGRIMVQGLLTATVPTKLGGDMDYIAGEISIRFVRPVFVGDTIKCEAIVTNVEQREDRALVSIDMVCRNQFGKDVLVGSTKGFIRQ